MTTKFTPTDGTGANFGGTFTLARKVTADGTYTLTKIYLRVNNTTVAMDIRALLYSDSGGHVGSLLAWSDKQNINIASLSTVTFDINHGTGAVLSNGTDYWLGVVYSVSSGQLSLETDTSTTTATSRHNADSTPLNSPSQGLSFGVDVTNGATFGIWAEVQQSVSFDLGVATFTYTAINPTAPLAHTFPLDVGAFVLTLPAPAFSPLVLHIPLGVGTFTLTGQSTTRAITIALGTSVFDLNAGAGDGKLLFLVHRGHQHAARGEPAPAPVLQDLGTPAEKLQVERS